MAVDLLGATLPVPLLIVIIAILVFAGIAFFAFMVLMFALQIPDVFSQIKCQMKRQASVSMHFVNRQMKMFAPQREGKNKQKNTLNLPKALGAKFDPSGEGMEEIWGKSINYHFFSKTSYPLKPLHAKAVQDFYKFLGEKGIAANKPLIDFLLVENMDTLEVYTKPLRDWVVKNLPLPIATDREYLLDKNIIANDKKTVVNNIAIIENKIRELESLEREDIVDVDKHNIDLQILNESLQKYNAELTNVQTRESEFSKLQEYKKQLLETENKLKELNSNKIQLLENIDIMLGYLNPETRETVYTMRQLKNDLQEKVISEGLFVFPKVQELIFAASSLNSSGMNEAVSIANADAYMQNTEPTGALTPQTMAFFVILGVVALGGVGIAFKIMSS